MQSYPPSFFLCLSSNSSNSLSRLFQSIFSLPSATRQASQTPSPFIARVVFLLSMVCLNSVADAGLWLDITHFLQKTTLPGNPYLASRCISGSAYSFLKIRIHLQT